MNPFHSMAVWLASLLPDGASDVLVAGASMLGIVIVMAGVLALAVSVAAYVTDAEDAP